MPRSQDHARAGHRRSRSASPSPNDPPMSTPLSAPSATPLPVLGPSSGLAGGLRWKVCALLFVATTINYMDRQILWILAPVLEREIGWSEVDYSNIVVAFQVAYALGLLGAGALLDRFG